MGENFNIIYCKHNDVKFLKGDITFQICLAVNKIVRWQAVGAQHIPGVWLICVKSREAKKMLLTTHIKIEIRDVTFYADNPFEMGRRNQDAERIVIRDFPLCKTNTQICNFVKSMPQLTALTEVFNSKARNNVTNGASSFTNGDGYMFVKQEFDPLIPEKVCIGDYTCRVWHVSRDVQCKRCGSKTHRTSNTGMCNYYTPPLDHVHAFNSGRLSHFNRCAVHMGPLTFDSSEHAYQFRACEEHLHPDLAEQILHANTPRETKSIAAVIKKCEGTGIWLNMTL